MEPKAIGETLRARRRALGLSQRELAQLADLGERLIHEVEKGAGNPRLNNLRAICTALGLEIEVRPR